MKNPHGLKNHPNFMFCKACIEFQFNRHKCFVGCEDDLCTNKLYKSSMDVIYPLKNTLDKERVHCIGK